MCEGMCVHLAAFYVRGQLYQQECTQSLLILNTQDSYGDVLMLVIDCSSVWWIPSGRLWWQWTTVTTTGLLSRPDLPTQIHTHIHTADYRGHSLMKQIEVTSQNHRGISIYIAWSQLDDGFVSMGQMVRLQAVCNLCQCVCVCVLIPVRLEANNQTEHGLGSGI